MSLQQIDLSLIRTGGGTQMREALDTGVFMEYCAEWLAGTQFPPIDLFFDGTNYWLADGFHRFFGAREAKLKQIPAVVHEGSLRDAILFAIGANRTNGMRRTNPDKQKAVRTLLNDEVWVLWSDREVADKAGVSHTMVGTVRRELATKVMSPASRATQSRRACADGRLYGRVQTQAKPAAPQPPSSVPSSKQPQTGVATPPHPAPPMAMHSIEDLESAATALASLKRIARPDATIERVVASLEKWVADKGVPSAKRPAESRRASETLPLRPIPIAPMA